MEWLDEEMYTGGLGPGYAREAGTGVPRLVVEGYGFRVADEPEPHRLLKACGPHGRGS